MKNKLPESLIMEIVNNKVINIDNILMALSKENNYEMLKEYYEFLNNPNNINKNDYEGLDVIIFALKSKIKKIETVHKLKNTLNDAKKINIGLKRLNIIENLKENNDANKNMYYLKIENTDKSLTILEIHNLEVLLKLITTLAPTISVDEFINILKNRYFKELPTFGMGKDQINILEYEHTSFIPDKANFKVEKELLNDDYPDIVPKVSIDSNYERLYHIGSNIIKFHDVNGKRQKEVLATTSTEKDYGEISYSSMGETSYNKEQNINITRNDLDDIYVSIDEVTPLLKMYLNNKHLENTEKTKIFAFLLSLLTSIETDFALTEEEENLLDLAIDNIKNKERNNIEQEILNRYNAYYEKEENDSKMLNTNSKKKTYSNAPSSPLLFGDDGISLTIIIITVTVVLGGLLAALLLVK